MAMVGLWRSSDIKMVVICNGHHHLGAWNSSEQM